LSDCWAGATPGRCLKNKIWLEQNSRLRQRQYLCFKDLRDRNTRKGGGHIRLKGRGGHFMHTLANVVKLCSCFSMQSNKAYNVLVFHYSAKF
jgi:hypothetical protein